MDNDSTNREPERAHTGRSGLGRAWRRALVRWTATLMAVSVSLASGGGAADASPAHWRVVRSPSPTQLSALYGVTRVPGSHTFWAVGLFGLTERTFGRSGWKVMPSVHSTRWLELHGVASAGRGATWAVGLVTTRDESLRGVIEHWNGRAWDHVPAAFPPGTYSSAFAGVRAFSARDLLAVGQYSTPAGSGPLVDHWNGHRWSVSLARPVPGCDTATLVAVTAVPGTTHRFAVGACGSSSSPEAPDRPLIEYFDGRRWTIARSPRADGLGLRDVTATSATSVWALGDYGLIEHWNGRAWKIAPSPIFDGQLNSIVYVPDTRIMWAVGDRYNPATDADLAVIERWDGHVWTLVRTPRTGKASRLFSIAASSARNVIAVGLHASPNQDSLDTLILRYH